MEFVIGPYKVMQRTEFSKMRLFDRHTEEDITNENEKLLEDITCAYKKQSLNPDKYFTFIENTIIDISEEAFNANYLFIPDGVRTIDRYTFHNLVDLYEVYLPESIDVIGPGVFSACCALKSVETKNLMFISNKTFHNCTSLENVILNDSINMIDGFAFANCENLKHIMLPKNLTILGESSFLNCSSLENIILPETLEMIRSECFAGCSALKKIVLPDNLDSIDYKAFMNCTQLESVKLPENIKVLRFGLFSGCKNLRDITLPDSVVVLGGDMFEGTKKLESINVPKNLEDINGMPFANSGIKSLIFNHDLESLSRYSDGLIYGTDINKLIIDNTVKKITPYVVGPAGYQIKEIDYMGTEKEFKKFKRNNRKLFEILTNIENINFNEQSVERECIKDFPR